MTRYDTFILYAFVILLILRFVLAQTAMRSRSQRILPWAQLAGKRIPRGKGVTLLVKDRWLMGAVYGQLARGSIVIRAADGSFTEVDTGGY
jgi:hypothetical protein